MKPAVLLLMRNEVELADLRVLLDLRGFPILATPSVDQARQWLRDRSIELHAMVTDLPYGDPYENIVGLRPDLRIVWIGASESTVIELLRGAVAILGRRWKAFARPRCAGRLFTERSQKEAA